MVRYFLELAFNGSDFHGWQVQPNAVTVQALIEDAVSKLLNSKTGIVGCGRTDTGVHASYYVAHFDTHAEINDNEEFCYKLNCILPYSISILSVTKVDNEAHARFSATTRTYKYYLITNKSPFFNNLTYHCKYKLDFELMNIAAKKLYDYNDFTSFSKLHTDTKTNLCTISKAQWEWDDNKWVFTITANRFLRNMVRAIVGTLIDVGRKKITVKEFENIIKAKNRNIAGTSAQAKGLFLTDVKYPEDIFVK